MKQLQFPLTVTVTSQGSAYATQSIAGLRCSCTVSAEQAMRGLCDKIAAQQGIPAGELLARRLDAKGLAWSKTVWRIERVAIGAVFIRSGIGYLDGIECGYAVAVKTGEGQHDYRVAAYVFQEADAALFSEALRSASQGAG